MSKIALAPSASGTGTLTISAPNTNTDRAIALPDAAGTVFVSGQALSATTGTFTGLLDISAAGAGQIKFPATQNPSANANTLDDYEEGTFTPVITGSTTNPSVTYSVQNGFYCKIGRTVIAQGRIGTSAWSGGSGDLRVSLPFTSNSTSGYRASGSCSYILNITNGGSAFVPQVGENATYMVFYKYVDSDEFSTEVPANSNTSGTTQINFTVVYQV